MTPSFLPVAKDNSFWSTKDPVTQNERSNQHRSFGNDLLSLSLSLSLYPSLSLSLSCSLWLCSCKGFLICVITERGPVLV